jgi:hypothetical protein
MFLLLAAEFMERLWQERLQRRALTALIEMNDFGHAASFNIMKVIHGGFRYLLKSIEELFNITGILKFSAHPQS